MPFFKKKDKNVTATPPKAAEGPSAPQITEFTFLRTTTNLQEVIQPPSYPEDDLPLPVTPNKETRSPSRSLFHRTPKAPTPKAPASTSLTNEKKTTKPRLVSPPPSPRRVSGRLEKFSIGRARSTSSTSSIHVPANLPDIPSSGLDTKNAEAEWEKRAMLLAQGGTRSRSASSASVKASQESAGRLRSAAGDVNIQEAIRLHEAEDYTRSTAMFCKLADPQGENNALSQVLYGLALRHGWGTPANPTLALSYFSHAAANAASIESTGLASVLSTSGGPAKGELTLAIFELGNSFRHGWGVEKDPVAARVYYECAANLGDADALREAAWCYTEGFGGVKDRSRAAGYLRRAEEKGGREAVASGDSWIWKKKYDPETM